MLRGLHIKNMALIDELEISFEEGLNVLTGETGAGKSILLGAVTTALGGRTGREMLREGAEYGLAELFFEIHRPDTLAALRMLEVPVEDDGSLIVSRRIYPNRTVNRVGDETVTAARLREIAALLVDIHSQNDQQSLLKKSNHLHILDSFGHDSIKEKKQKTQALFSEYQAYRNELAAMDADAETRKRQMDFTAYEIREIEAARLQPEEETELEARYRRMTNSRQILEALAQVHVDTGYERPESAGNQLSRALTLLKKAAEYDAALGGLQEQLLTIDSLTNDFNRELADYMSGMSFDDRDYAETENRLNQIHALEAKYGRTVPEVLDCLEQKRREYDGYAHYEERKAQLEADRQAALTQYRQAAAELTRERKETAARLTRLIEEAMKELNFPDVQFRMEFQELAEPTGTGMDDVWFTLSVNVGEPLKPLWEVASGGELSRIMLAVKSCLAEEDSIDTLIFDEIDVGISGRTAQKVSERLSVLGRRRQVLCISHLPQIAAMADDHYKIEKHVEGERTISEIRRLTEPESIEEIARLLGGVEITETVRSGAAEMKEMARRTKIY